MKKLIKQGVTKLLARRGLVIKPSGGGYISAEKTISAAERAGLSVCDYVEQLWDQQGDTGKVIEKMASSGSFATKNPVVIEIGAGTGRFLEKVFNECEPARYESYETAKDWAEWLATRYPIISHEADGVSLRQTPSLSADLVHAHGVFVYLPFLTSYRYLQEIWRITKCGGMVVFDIISEDCLDKEDVDKWLNSNINYPCFLSRPYVVSLFEKQGFSLTNTFRNRHGVGNSEYLVFNRQQTA